MTKWYHDSTHLCTLVQEAERERDLRLERLRARELASMGVHNIEDETVTPSPENLGFGIFTLLLPMMVTASPGARITSSGSRREQVEAAGIAATATLIARKQKLHEQLEAAAWDWFFKPFCAGFIEKAPANLSDRTEEEQDAARARLYNHEAEDVGGEAGDAKAPRADDTPRVQTPPRFPRIKTIEPDRCGFDCAGRTISEARFTWHETIEDLELLRQRARENPDDWDADAIEAMPRCDRSGETSDDDKGGYGRYYVIYIPGGMVEDEDPEPGEHGVIYTVASTYGDRGEITGSYEIRKPYGWSGIPSGPHIFEGQYTTGVDAFGMTLLGANEESLANLEALAEALYQRIRDHKTVYAYDSAIEADVQPLIQARNGAYVAVPGLRDNVIQPIETSMVSPAEIAEYRESLANAGRNLGIDEAARGRASGSATATAVSVADRATQTKIEYMLARWMRFPLRCIEALAWEIGHDYDVVMQLDSSGREQDARSRVEPVAQHYGMGRDYVETVVEALKAEDLEFGGGAFNEPDFDWNNLDIQIEPHSMDGTSGERALQREMQWNQVLAFIGQQAIANPHIRWADRLRATGRAFGMPDADSLFDPDKASEMVQMQIMGPSAQPSADINGEKTVQHRASGGPNRQGEAPPSDFNAA